MPNNPIRFKRGYQAPQIGKASKAYVARELTVSEGKAPVLSSSSSSPSASSSTATGGAGWSPRLAVEPDGARRVLRIAGWVGGTGVQPGYVGYYLSDAGPVANISLAEDIRGAAGAQAVAPVAISDSTIDASVTADCYTITLSGNTTLAITNIGTVNGKEFEVIVTNPSTHTLAWPSAVKWPGTTPTQSTGNKIDRYRCRIVGSVVYASVIAQGYTP